MSDEEGAICDQCGARIGPNGCCATVRKLFDAVTDELRASVEYLRYLADRSWGMGVADALNAAADDMRRLRHRDLAKNREIAKKRGGGS